MTIRHLYPAVEPSLNLDFANRKKLDSRITFVRGSIGTYVGEDGLIKTAADHEARFDHDSDGNSLGLLIEENRTNLLTYSEEFDDVSWIKSNVTVTTNTTAAPDGATTAETLTCSVGGQTFQHIRKASTLSAGTHTFSCYCKAGNISSIRLGAEGYTIYATFTLTGSGSSSGVTAGASASIQAFPNGWYRCSLTYVSAGGTLNNDIRFSSAATNDFIYIWGAQLETGAFPTSYIPTSGSTVTRSAEVVSMTGTNFSSWYNQSEGTWVAGLPIPAKQSNSRVFTGGTEIWADPTPRITAVRTGSSTNYISVTHPVIAAAAYNSSTCFGAAGGLLSANVGGTLTTPTQMIIGRSTAAGVGYINVPISRLTYYPTRLPDATLQALTL